MNRMNLLVLLCILGICAVLGRSAREPVIDPHELLIGRWRAVDLPAMCFSWDYQFMRDGRGTQYFDNGGVMRRFRYNFDGSLLTIFVDGEVSDGPDRLKFTDSDTLELASQALTVRFRRQPSSP